MTAQIRGLTPDTIAELINNPALYNELREGLVIDIETTVFGEDKPDERVSIKDTLAANVMLGNAILLESATPLGRQNVLYGMVHALTYLTHQWAPADCLEETQQQFVQLILAEHKPDANGNSSVTVGAVQ